MQPYTLFNKFQIWRIFLNASAGHWKRCSGPHAARGPVVGPHWSGSTAHQTSVVQLQQARGPHVARHLRGNIGPHITSSDSGDRGFRNDVVKNRYLKFWWRNMWAHPSNNRCYGATVQNSFQKSLILRSFSAMNFCSIATRSTWSINCLWMCKNILWFKWAWLSLFVK